MTPPPAWFTDGCQVRKMNIKYILCVIDSSQQKTKRNDQLLGS